MTIQDYGPLPDFCVPHFKIRPQHDVREFLTRYAKSGGPHHNAVCFGDARRRLRTGGGDDRCGLLRDLNDVSGPRSGHDQCQGAGDGPRGPAVGARGVSGPVAARRRRAAWNRTSRRSSRRRSPVMQQVAEAIDPAGIEAIGVSSQGGAMQVLDAAGAGRWAA